ncbi:DMT family transporter [uncultured Desulfovibrio sp.]|uniref:DMT family transporter n=1 Tax=uncultured Desulfovibrio sp. TaxID=167968 RepID=UPI0026388A3C|nr:DMT family transporter [uncultured Desulfovibrio sp.]
MSPCVTAHVAAVLTIFVWGGTFVSTKVLLRGFSPVEILFLRFALGALALALACPHRLHSRSLRDEGLFALAGLCGVTLYFLCENVALTHTLAANAAVIVSTAPFLTALLARLLLGESLQPRFFAGFICALGGVICISVNSGAVLRLNPLGDLLAFLAALTWALYSIFTRKISQCGYNMIQATRRIFCWGLLFMLPVLPLADVRWQTARFADPVLLGNLLFLGLGASALCFATWNYSIKTLGAVKTSVYIYLVPVVAVITAMLVLHEPFTWLAALGMGLVLLGLGISECRISPQRLRGGRKA